MESNALRHAITMLQGMESDLHSTPVLPSFCTTEEISALREGMLSASGGLRPMEIDATQCDGSKTTVAEELERYDLADDEQADAHNCGNGSYVEHTAMDTFGGTASASSTPPPPPPPAPSVELDSEGMPWDGRIHTTAKTKVANGTWKRARGVDKELVEAIKAEYLGNDMSQTPTSESIVTPKVEVITEAQPCVITDAPPPPPPPPPPTEQGDPVRIFMSAVAKSGILPSSINAVLQKHGVQTLQKIREHADKIPAIREDLGI